MRRFVSVVGGIAMALVLSTSAIAATVNFSQASIDAAHPLAFFVHTATAGQLGAKATWQGASCCSNGHFSTLTLSVILVTEPTDNYQEIDNNGESCSVGGGKPLSCYVLTDPFTKGGVAPSGWYIVKVEEFGADTETNVKVSVYGNIDQTAPGPTVLYP